MANPGGSDVSTGKTCSVPLSSSLAEKRGTRATGWRPGPATAVAGLLPWMALISLEAIADCHALSGGPAPDDGADDDAAAAAAEEDEDWPAGVEAEAAAAAAGGWAF